jgi:hypothetical protein
MGLEAGEGSSYKAPAGRATEAYVSTPQEARPRATP